MELSTPLPFTAEAVFGFDGASVYAQTGLRVVRWDLASGAQHVVSSAAERPSAVSFDASTSTIVLGYSGAPPHIEVIVAGASPIALEIPSEWQTATIIPAVAAHAGGFVVAAGGEYGRSIALWSLSTHELLSGATVQLPFAPSWISFNPALSTMIAAGGDEGTGFISLSQSFECWRALWIPIQTTANSTTTTGARPAGAADPLKVACELNLMEVTKSYCTRPVGGRLRRELTHAEQQRADLLNGRGVWSAPVWTGSETLVVANAAGQIAAINAGTGSFICAPVTLSHNTAAATAASMPVVVSAMAPVSCGRAIAACSDGCMRAVELTDGGIAVSAIELNSQSISASAASDAGGARTAASAHTAGIIPKDTIIALLPTSASFNDDAAAGSKRHLAITTTGALTVLNVDVDTPPLSHSASGNSGSSSPSPVLSFSAVPRRLWSSCPSIVSGEIAIVPLSSIAPAAAASASTGLLAVDADGDIRLWSSSQSSSHGRADGFHAAPIVYGDGRSIGSMRLPLSHDDHVECGAVHPDLPLLAVGTSKGLVFIVATHPIPHASSSVDFVNANSSSGGGGENATSEDAGAAVVFTVLHLDRLGERSVIAMEWCSRDDGTSHLAVINGEDKLLTVMDISLSASSTVATTSSGPSAAAAIRARVLAVANLPAPDFACLTWVRDQLKGITIFLGTRSGHLLSLSPLDEWDTAPAHSSGGDDAAGVIDATALLRLRARLPAGITAMAGTLAVSTEYHASTSITDCSPRGDGVLFVASGETIAALPYDAFHLASDEIPTIEGVYEGVPAGSTAVLTLLTAHRSACAAVTIASLGDVPSAILMASIGTDGTLVAWGISVEVRPSVDDASPPELALQVVTNAVTQTQMTSRHRLAFTRNAQQLCCSGGYSGTHSGMLLSRVEGGITGSLLSAAARVPRSVYPSEPPHAVSASRLWTTLDWAAASATATAGADAAAAAPVRRRMEAAAHERKAAAASQLKGSVAIELRQLCDELAALQLANAAAPELERLQPSEFLLDVEAMATLKAQSEKQVVAIQRDAEAEVARLKGEIEQWRADVWDCMEVHSTALRSISRPAAAGAAPAASSAANSSSVPGTCVVNFPIRKRDPSAVEILGRMALLRKMELLTLRDDVANGGGGGTPGLWPGLSSFFPGVDYVFGAGKMAYTSDPIRQAELNRLGGGDGSASGGGVAAASSGLDGSDADSTADESGVAQEDEGAGVSSDAGIAAATAGLPLHGESLVSLLYHPAGVRTPAQKRMQIVFLHELVRAIKVQFNASFDKLSAEKREALATIRARHKRFAAVYRALGERVHHVRSGASNAANGGEDSAAPASSADGSGTPTEAVLVDTQSSAHLPVRELVDPAQFDDEVPESAFIANESDVDAACPEYRELKARFAGGASAQASLSGGVSQDVTMRALMEIMDGKLEGRNRLATLAAAINRAPWMDLMHESDMNAEQRDLLAASNARLLAYNEEKAKQRNLLMTELTKLTSELRSLETGFQSKLESLHASRSKVHRMVIAIEFYMARLSLAVQARFDVITRNRALEQAWLELIPQEEEAANAHEEFKALMEAQAATIAQLKTADEGLEKGTRERVKAASGGALDADVLHAAVGLVKLRRGAKLTPTVGSSSTRFPSTTTKPSVIAGAARLKGDNGKSTTAAGVSAPAAGAGAAPPDDTPLTLADCPDGYGSLADNPIWPVLNQLRREKLDSERSLAAAQARLTAMQAHLSHLAASYEQLKSRIDEIGVERDALASSREVATNDVDLLIRLNQGRDEVVAPVGSDTESHYSDAMLIPTSAIESVNSVVRQLGARRITSLKDMMAFRSTYLVMQWEERALATREEDAREFYKDLQLMRAMGDVRRFITGVSLGSKARIEEDTEAKRMATHRAAAARSAIAAERHAKTLERRIAGMNEQAANALASQRGHEERITLMKEKLNISPATTAVPGLLALKSSSVSTAVSGSSSPVSALESTRMRMFAEQSRLRVLAVKRKAELRRLTAEAEKARRRTFVMLPVQQQQQQSPTDSS